MTHAQRIEQLIEDNFADAADSPRALRAQVRALTAQLATARDALTATNLDNEFLKKQNAKFIDRIEDLECRVLSAKGQPA